MEKIKLTPEFLAKTIAPKKVIIVLLPFVLVGLWFFGMFLFGILTMLNEAGDEVLTIANYDVSAKYFCYFFILVIIIAFIPFIYFIVTKLIGNILENNRIIKNRQYTIIKDKIIEIKNTQSKNGFTYLVKLEQYFNRYNREAIYSSNDTPIEVGDECYVVMLDDEKGFVGGIFPTSKYEIY